MKHELLTYLDRTELWIAAAGLAVFLAGIWVLRGAPPGQAAAGEEDADAPRAGYRDRIVVAVVVGLILILGAAFVALSRGVLWSLPIFALGFGLVLFLIAQNRRYRHASPSLRRTIDFSTAFVNSSLLAGILIVFNVIAFRYGGQPIDVTRERTYSLSSLTLNQLKSLERPVAFTMIFGQGQRASRQRARVVQLLEAYKAANPQMIQLVSLDPFNDLPRLDELAKHVPELELLHGGGVVIEYGEGESALYVVVRNQDLFQPILLDPAHGGRNHFASAFTGEDEFTSAVMRLREGKKSRIAFTTGHGEPLSSDLNPRGRGIGEWKARFNKVGCEVIDLNLIQDDIPRDLSLLIVVGPKSPFKPDELTKLRSLAVEGRPVLLMVGNTEPTGLDLFLKSFNLEIGRGLVIDPQSNFNRNASLVFAPLQAGVKHPIVDPLGVNRAVLLTGAAPIMVFGMHSRDSAHNQPVDANLVPVPILRTSSFSWAETEPQTSPVRLDRDKDEPGPLTVGVAVADRAASRSQGEGSALGKPRLVLFSCPAMAENVFQEYERTNLDLLMNAASWLRGRPDTQGIAPHTHVALTLSVDPSLRSRLILVPSFVAVMLFVAMGIIVFIARRE
ncbi:MAG: Gldg family protein [Isosphaerales bacterium]